MDDHMTARQRIVEHWQFYLCYFFDWHTAVVQADEYIRSTWWKA